MSSFIDLTIPSGNALSVENLKIPTTMSQTHSDCPGLGYCIKSKGNNTPNIMWEKPITDTITDSYVDYVTEPTASKSSTNTYSGTVNSWSTSIGANGYAYMFGSTAATSTVNKRVYMNNNAYYISYSIPAGKTIHVEVTVQGNAPMTVANSSGFQTPLYSVQQNSTIGTFYLTISTSTSANVSVLQKLSVTTPIYTSSQNYKDTYILEYTNTGTSARTVYIQCYAIQSGIPFTQLTESSRANVTSGTLNFNVKTNTSIYNYSTTPGEFQTGGYYGTNGMAFVSNTLKTATVNIPSRFGVVTGDYGLKITSSGIQKTTDGGTTWVSY